MSAEEIAVLVGVVLSFAFEFLPRVSVWYENLETVYKRLVALGLGAAVVGATLGLSCAELFGIASFTCDSVGIQTALRSFVMFIFANQTTYALVFSGDTRNK